METKHTKGEWQIRNFNDHDLYSIIHNDLGVRICEVKSYTANIFNDPSVEERKANAKLISAAPKLLEACIAAEKHHQGAHSEIGYMLRKAIEKATK